MIEGALYCGTKQKSSRSILVNLEKRSRGEGCSHFRKKGTKQKLFMRRVSQNHDSIARNSPEVFVGKDVHIAGESHCDLCVVYVICRVAASPCAEQRRSAIKTTAQQCKKTQRSKRHSYHWVSLVLVRKQRVGRDGGLAFRAGFPSLTIIPSLQVLGMLESTPVKIAQVPGVRHKHWGSGGRENQLDYYKFHGPGH